MSDLSELLSTYSKLQQQRTIAITDRLARSQQQLASEILTIQECERQFIAAENKVLDQIRPLLATDARSLLTTREFQYFARSLNEKLDVDATKKFESLQTPIDPDEWQLRTLPTCLQLQNIEAVLAHDPTYGAIAPDGGIRMQIREGTWQQLIFLPNDSARQWLQLAHQLQRTRMDLPVEDDLQFDLIQEIVCLLAYVTTLFWIEGMTNQFD